MYMFRYYMHAALQCIVLCVLPIRFTCVQLVKKFATFCGTQRFMTMFTTDRHLPLS